MAYDCKNQRTFLLKAIVFLSILTNVYKSLCPCTCMHTVRHTNSKPRTHTVVNGPGNGHIYSSNNHTISFSHSHQYDKLSLPIAIRAAQKTSLCTSVWDFGSNHTHHLFMVILLSGQVETNPGPTNSVDYPCGICQSEVEENDNALLCDTCNLWCHTNCCGMSNQNYDLLCNKSKSFSWICFQCGCPNFNSSLFATASFEMSNPFSTLSSDFEESNNTGTSTQTQPLTSTPTRPNSANQSNFKPPKNRKTGLKGMVINCNGLKSSAKQAAFRASVEYHRPDIIMGCESKIDNKMHTYSLFPDNYTVYRKDRNANGGGVFVATKDTLISDNLPNLDSDCEIIWTSLQFTGSKPLYIASFYGPQINKAAAVDELSKSITPLLGKRRNTYPNIIIGGDFNFPDIDWSSWTTTNPKTASYHSKFLNFLLENSLSQLVTKITRPISNSTLDLITTTCPHLINNIESLPGISDHNIVLFNINMNPKTQTKPPRKVFNFQKANIDNLKSITKEFSHEFLSSNPEGNSVDSNWGTIRDFLKNLMNSHIPFKIRGGKRHLPWITYQIKRKMRKRDRLYTLARKLNLSSHWKSFRQYRNSVTKIVRQAHINYVNNIIGGSLTEKPKTFWSYVKLMRTENLGIPTLRTPSKLCATDKDKAQALNEQFQSVFNPCVSDNIPDKGVSPYPSIPDLIIHHEGVVKQLKQLNPSKASGPDEIPPRLLKTVAEELAPVLTFLFQQSIDNGEVPSQWRQALVTGIFKKGIKSDPANYRPISLTCLCCKIQEHIVLSHMAKHLSQHNILLDSQHGFRECLSTVTQLITSVHDWATTLEHRGQTDVILLDFSKAFDKVSHQHLSAKLTFYGIRGSTLAWINAFLAGRRQAVSVNGQHSSWELVTSGVPQGSVLGPALFLLFINDIQDNIKSSIRLFADDSIVYRIIRSYKDHQILQQDLQVLAEWSRVWLMEFNINKCAVLSISRKRSPSHFQYTIFGQPLSKVDQYDYLGITIAKDLRWNSHCHTTIRKANRTLGLLRRTLAPCSRDVKARAYESLVRPRLEYASQVWNPPTTTLVNQLEQVQRAAARFVSADYRRTTHVTPLITNLGWDSLHVRRLLNQGVMFYKIHHNLVNIPFPPCVIPATYFSRNDHQLKYQLPSTTTEAYRLSFYPRAIRIWNWLPPTVVSSPSVAVFKEIALPAIRVMLPAPGIKLL